MFVISAIAVHTDSIHALCGRLSAAGICVFWSDYSLGIVNESPNIQVCLVFVSVCSAGFVWCVKLFIPQGSRSIEDLDTAKKYFRV